jgi:hypothetical protein
MLRLCGKRVSVWDYTVRFWYSNSSTNNIIQVSEGRAESVVCLRRPADWRERRAPANSSAHAEIDDIMCNRQSMCIYYMIYTAAAHVAYSNIYTYIGGSRQAGILPVYTKRMKKKIVDDGRI